jgi:glyoxylase-like metal-dependent hydrolase (beta-lactamase superfamily II)/rhodanese-related sulfurtransferase
LLAATLPAARAHEEARMIFRQLFDSTSGTYTYLLASRRGGEALIIDPVLEKVERYIQLVRELDLKLIKAVDTHLHADHVTGLGALRDRTHCVTVMGEHSKVDVVSMRLAEGDKLTIEGVALDVLYTPGHTDDSYSFLMRDRVFTGDTLLIRGTGRTDFQNGDARAQYDSIFNKLLRLPEETMVFPAHDYKGDTVSTIGEEKAFNPRLQVKSVDEYVDLMGKLNLPNPKMMDVAVPANMRQGLAQEEIARRGWAISANEAQALVGRPDVTLIDLRERSEREKHGTIPGSLHAPYPDLPANVRPGGMLHELAAATGRRIVFYCAFGERSAMAVQAAQDAGITSACHIAGGIDAWKKANGPLLRQ